MYRRYKAAGVVLGAIFMAMVSMDTQAAQLGEDLSVGIASTFDQTTNTEEETQATAEVVWTGTPLEGYVNIGIANVDDNLNIREAADEGSSLTGKLRNWVSAKDIILKMLEILSTKGNVGCMVEYFGEGVGTLTVPQRATITNMGAELGVTCSIFPSDAMTREFESVLYKAALEFTHGRKVEAAQKLGVGRNTLTRKIQELGIG